MSYPGIVAFDLDGTIWRGWLNEKWVGQKGRVSDYLQDNLEVIEYGGETIIRDRKNEDFRCIIASDIAHIIQDLCKHGVAIAIASRNTNRTLTDRALWLINIHDPKDNIIKPFTKMLKYDEVKDVSKMEHFKNIKEWSVTFMKVDPRFGVTWDDYNRGLNRWRRYNAIQFQIPRNGVESREVKFIGYVGADEASAMRYQEGKRRLKSNRVSRWGHGMYVTDDPQVAEFFAKFGRQDTPWNQYVVAVYARNRDAFDKLNKVWVPEYGTFPQINNLNQTDEETAKSQHKLDKLIMRKFDVEKPFILFSRHHRMKGMTFLPKHTRFNEMVAYPNLQDALFFGEPFRIANFVADRERGLWGNAEWHRRLQELNIKMIPETVEDFETHKEHIG
ncbi:acid phosphatase-domain-containing protein [Nemania sp. FL0031]|nr:acid phosphatase-domain-containing protein [Nemania sp. FL0031]